MGVDRDNDALCLAGLDLSLNQFLLKSPKSDWFHLLLVGPCKGYVGAKFSLCTSLSQSNPNIGQFGR